MSQQKLNTKQEDITSWVNNHSDDLYSWALYKTSSQEVAEDIIQDTFAAAVKSYEKFQRKSSPKTWLTNLKLNESELKLELKRVQVQNKVIQYYNEIEFLKDQVALMENVVSNYILLLDGEREKFNFGSSSLFLINSREKSLIESQLKLMTLKTKHQKAYYAYKWARGSNGLN